MSRVVLVTGGTRGIGAATVQRFRRNGDRVIAFYRSTPPPDGAIAVRCDVTDADAVEEAVADLQRSYGPVDVYVANAGMTLDKLSLRMSDDEFRTLLEANLVSGFRIARLVSRSMAARRTGRMVFVSSMIALCGAAGQVNYAASKAGLIGLARSLAWEYGPRGITVNVVAPGLIETGMTEDLSAARRSFMIGGTPLARMGRADEVAHAIEFLASEDAGFLTGVVLPVSGGFAMGH
jgi:3-oxoacyl-[acyl-carrier protein] reductase